jgi:hypothetical protein
MFFDAMSFLPIPFVLLCFMHMWFGDHRLITALPPLPPELWFCHFIACPSAQLAPAHEIDWTALKTHIRAETVTALEADALFISAMNARERYSNTCRILRDNRTPAASYSRRGRILGINKRNVKRHCQ